MSQKDIEALCAFELAVEGIVDLTGNCGKRVRRVLERYFPGGIFDLLLSAPVKFSNFEFACYMDLVREGCEWAQDCVAGNGRRMTFSAQVVNLQERTYRLSILNQGSLPESMKERQAFLRDTSVGVRRIIMMIEGTEDLAGHRALQDTFFDRLYNEDPTQDTEENRALMRGRFGALISKDYRDITALPVALVDLATQLDPDAWEALRSETERQPLRKAA